MKVVQTPLPGVIVFEPKRHADSRGFFLETYREDTLEEAGINERFVQDNHSQSSHGVLRALHFQLTQPQGKLVRVTRGAVFDVAVDVRSGSPTFGQWYGTTLDEDNMRMVYVPPGFAHGFLVLSDFADFIYKCTAYYHPQSEQGILWDDPDIGVEWPVNSGNILLSERDKQNSVLKNQPEMFLPLYSGV